MTDDSNKKKRNAVGHGDERHDNQESVKEPYKVGRNKPPKEHQFKPGKSGNPGGRPKGSKNKLPGNIGRLYKIALEEGCREIGIHDGDKTVTMSMLQTIFRKLGISGAKGNIAATKLFLSVIVDAEQANKDEIESIVIAAVKYKQVWSDYLDYHKKHGLANEMPIPHPEHVIINWDKEEVTIEGPIDRKQFNRQKAIINRMAGLEVELTLPCWDEGEDGKESTDRAITRKYLKKFRELIPLDDPLWLEFGVGFMENWKDYYSAAELDSNVPEEQVAYGPHMPKEELYVDPHIPEEQILHAEFTKSKDYDRLVRSAIQRVFSSIQNAAGEMKT